MKKVGYFLLAAGFLGGAFATSLHVQEVDWTIFSTAAVAAIVGLILVKRAASAVARSESVLELNRGELKESIQNIVRDLNELNTTAVKQGAQLRDKIDLVLFGKYGGTEVKIEGEEHLILREDDILGIIE